jgi:hypothetical protein
MIRAVELESRLREEAELATFGAEVKFVARKVVEG